MASSFKKKGSSSKPLHPLGSRPSLYNAQLLVSSGVPSMDLLLGGGLAVGSVLLIEEDRYGSYSRLLMKYFLSEGVMCGHTLLLASASEQTEDILKDLPGSTEDRQPATASQSQSSSAGHIATEKETEKTKESTKTFSRRPGVGGEGQGEEERAMTIAWRYQSKPKVQSLPFSNQFGHFYDLTVKMPATRVEAVKRVHFNALDNPLGTCRELYIALKRVVEETIREEHFSVAETTTKQRNILRIGLCSLGSPLWLGGVSEGDSSHSLLQFLHCLRAMVRQAYAVAVVTVPTHLIQEVVSVRRLERLCDAAVRLESFTGSHKETNPIYQDYHGLFHLHKLPCINSLVSYHPDTLDLAFKLKRKKFSIEKLHLPPEFSDTASRAQEETMKISKSNIMVPSEGGARKKLTPRYIDF